MRATVDRIENGIVVLELSDGTYLQFSHKLLPEAKEGDVVAFSVDSEAADMKKAELSERIKSIWKD